MIAFHDDWDDLKVSKTVEPVNENERGYLGINFSSDSKGVRVTRVGEETSAAKAGLKPGDIITHFNGKKLYSGSGVRDLIEKTKVGDKINVKVEREGKTLEMTIKLGKRP
jgi:S1-C subfamily serine protease